MTVAPTQLHLAETRGDVVRRRGTELRDRLAASDPGFARLRNGLGAAVSVGTALPVQLLVAKVLGFASSMRSRWATGC